MIVNYLIVCDMGHRNVLFTVDRVISIVNWYTTMVSMRLYYACTVWDTFSLEYLYNDIILCSEYLLLSVFSGVDILVTARIFKKLMSRIGYDRFYVAGDSLGSLVTTAMGVLYPYKY